MRHGEGKGDVSEWTCPVCQRDQVLITNRNVHSDWHILKVGETVHGLLAVEIDSIRCANAKCNELALQAKLVKVKQSPGGGYEQVEGGEVQRWQLRPESMARPQPDYIPQPLREDYEEACKIRDLSPKASATLARRCLQGMIRNFCGISKSTLFDEIKEMRDHISSGTAPRGVEPETVDAIDHVRSIGNVGAHMERDINQIVEVDPGEAQALIELIEMLFEEWYVARHKRQARLSKVQSIAGSKAEIIAEYKMAAKSPSPDE
jgi:hypothetical protein